MKIYCIKSIDNQESELFASLDAMARWINAKNPIDGQFVVRGDGRAYDVTANNLEAAYNSSMASGLAPSIVIRQDFFVQAIETEYVFSTVNVIE